MKDTSCRTSNVGLNIQTDEEVSHEKDTMWIEKMKYSIQKKADEKEDDANEEVRSGRRCWLFSCFTLTHDLQEIKGRYEASKWDGMKWCWWNFQAYESSKKMLRYVNVVHVKDSRWDGTNVWLKEWEDQIKRKMREEILARQANGGLFLPVCLIQVWVSLSLSAFSGFLFL